MEQLLDLLESLERASALANPHYCPEDWKRLKECIRALRLQCQACGAVVTPTLPGPKIAGQYTKGSGI